MSFNYKNDDGIFIKMPSFYKQKLKRYCEENDTNTSQLIREFIENKINVNPSEDYQKMVDQHVDNADSEKER